MSKPRCPRCNSPGDTGVLVNAISCPVMDRNADLFGTSLVTVEPEGCEPGTTRSTRGHRYTCRLPDLLPGRLIEGISPRIVASELDPIDQMWAR